MSLQIAELHKIYASNKYNPTVFFLNPFTEVLFLNNWVWPQEYIAQKKVPIKKTHPSGDNLKQKIKQWFVSLNFQSQRNCLMIKDNIFIESLCRFLNSYSSGNLYSMKSRKYIKNIEASQMNSFVQKGLNLILQNLEIAFLKEPILHLSKNCQKFLCNELIKWMEIISHKKIFQFANKIKQSEDLEDNILWFSQNSFHKLEYFIVNEFEKLIIKNYFNRDRIQSNYLQDITNFCLNEKDCCKNKNIDLQLLRFPLKKTAQLSTKQIQAKFAQINQIEETYEREKQKLIQILLDDKIDQTTKDQAKKKRRRIRKKFKADDQVENCSVEEKIKKKQIKQSPSQVKKSKKIIKFEIEEECQSAQYDQKVNLVFNDQISQISKCEDSQFHETDVTFQKYFESEDKTIVPEIQCQNIIQKINEFSQDRCMKKSSEEPLEYIENNKINQKSLQSASQNMTENVDQNAAKSSVNKQRKKSKKQKICESIQDNLIKSIRNTSFTQFIDSISIQSNNLYNYKLSAYQFIVFFISSLLPTTNITLFGSNAVGLSLASSDIDIMISNIRWSSISEVRQVLYHIGNEISKMGWVIDYRLILNAKVPVLKLFIDPKINYFDMSPLKYASQTTLTESIVIKADIIVNIEEQQNIGCQSTLLMKEWLTDHPQLQRIILFFKYVLWYYGLNENYRGGICSYCLFLMIVSCLFKKVQALKTGEKTISQVLDDQDQGAYILEILKYYSEAFDPKVDEIVIQKELNISSSLKLKQYQTEINYLKRNLALKVLDPINGQYIESSFSKFQQIQQLFSMILVESMKSDEQTKRFLNSNDDVNDEISKYYQSISQNGAGYNVITKNMQQANDTKVKKLIKKISTKIKKNQSVKYSVKQIVSIGFKIGIQNWMSSNNNSSEQKFNI